MIETKVQLKNGKWEYIKIDYNPQGHDLQVGKIFKRGRRKFKVEEIVVHSIKLKEI